MQKLPETSDRKRDDTCAKKEPSQQKKEAHSLSAVTTSKSFLYTLANLSTSSSYLFYQRPMTKNTK